MSEIGCRFVQAYYEVLSKSPHKMHKFYCPQSRYTFAVGSQDSPAVKGQEAIFQKIAELGFDDVRVDLESGSVDIQPSKQNIMVMVTGTFSMKGQSAKPFVQTMLLAHLGSWVVVNDVCRVLDKNALLKSCDTKVHGLNRGQEEELIADPLLAADNGAAAPSAVAAQEPQQAAASTKAKAPEAAADSSSPGEEAQQQPGNESTETGKGAAPEVAAAAAAAAPQQEEGGACVEANGAKGVASGEKAEKEDTQAAAAQSTEPAACVAASADAAPAPQAVEEPKAKPTSYAAALLMAKSKKSVAPRKRPAEAAGPAAPPAKAPAAAAHHRAERKPVRRSEGASVFVRNIEAATTEQDVKDAYGQFGGIKSVSLRTERGFGFIEFADASSVQKALEAQGNQTFSSTFVIEERRNTGRGRGSSRFGHDDRRDSRGRGRRGGRGRGRGERR